MKVQLLHDYELVGVSRAEAAELLKARRQFTAEQGYIEARQWIDGRFADPEVPKKWLKERRPDLYDALYPARAQLPERLKEAQKKLDRENVGKGIKEYLEKNPQVRGFFWGRAGTTTLRRYVRPYEEKSRLTQLRREKILSCLPEFSVVKMKSHIQFLTTPTADTPGTTLLIHFDNKRYIIGNISEGTQRAFVEYGARLIKVSYIFITGKTE